jgi:hypothetical protein
MPDQVASTPWSYGRMIPAKTERPGNRVGAAARVRIIAISGTMPDPLATSISGPPSEGSQTK